MKRELLMPKLGLTMTEGAIADWMVGASQPFKAGQGLYVVETDKVANEIVAEGDGMLLEIAVQIGETVPVGTVIGFWDDAPAGTRAATPAAPAAVATATATATTSTAATASSAPATPARQDCPTTAAPTPSTAAPAVAGSPTRIIASPYARRLARERGVALARIAGTGPNGRIVARDVQSAAEHAIPVASALATQVMQPSSAPAAIARTTQPAPGADYDLIAPTARQTTAARRLTQGKQDTPHFYLALEADVSSLIALRKEINEADLGVRLTLNHFIVKAVIDSLRKHPALNRVWSDQGIVAYRRIDVGIAVDAPGGLLAPAVTDVGGITIRALAARLTDLAERARAGLLTAADQGAPAITISNAGMHNVTYMTSIINPGQAMILGVGSIKGVFRPDDRGQPVLRQELGLVLSLDHRIMDGVAGLKFLNTIVHCLEHPAQLLLH